MENTVAPSRQTTVRIDLNGREFILVGTAHISQASVDEVETVIRAENPDKVCVELDEGRYKTIVENAAWKNIDISRVLKEKKGFLLFANIILTSFQKRLGLETGVKPGEEMVKAINLAKELGIDTVLCDREVQTTLRRAWAKSSFWGKNKMLAVLLSSLLTNEKISPEELEKIKEKDIMHSMLEEMSRYLPKVKEVLIDERDRYLAVKIFQAEGRKNVAVVGAGHVDGIVGHLKLLAEGKEEADVSELETIPKSGILKKIVPWTIPVLFSGLIALGVFTKGPEALSTGLLTWTIVTASSAALGSLLSFAHPLATLAAAAAAPITSILPIIGSGMVSGLVQYNVKKPKVDDFEALPNDVMLFRRFYHNRILKVLLNFILTNFVGSIGTIVGLSILGIRLG
ncbi:MAG: TraB/GumN family protein [Spirochaetales bacterium]|nr:TraB/GumN family protein [Spirochaetales bacterium]